MTVAVCLLAYSLLVLAIGPRLLRRSTATGHAPRAGILAWQAASWSVIGSWVLAGLTMTTTATVPTQGPGGLFHACLTVVREAVSPPHSAWLRLAGAAVAVGVATRAVGCLMHGWWVARRRRRRHLAVLRMIGRPRPGLGALVLDQVIEPVVYCLPGRAGRVVATAGALDRLTGTQLQAVLAHERAHLHGWHHLPLGAAQSLDRAFPGIALFRIAAVETARLVEMRADDVAARRYGCQQVAEALIALADGPAPRDALAAAGVETAQRVERMLSGRTHPLRAGWPSLTLVALFAVGPLVSVLLPILGMTVRYWGICPLPT